MLNKPVFHPGWILVLLAGLLLGCSGNQSSQERAPETSPAEQPGRAEAPAPSESAAQSSSFSKTLSLQGVSFTINATPDGQLTVQPGGLEDNEAWVRQIEGQVTGAEIEDLNSNGSPEVVVYISSGAENYGTVMGFTALGKSAMIQVNFPDIRNNPEASEGYQGRDDFALVETSLVRRFPVYQNGSPTGKTRQIQYKMVAGEAMPTFSIDKIVEY